MGLCQTATLRFHGNVVALWEGFRAYTERTGENLVDLGSDQTSLHNPYNGGMLLLFFIKILEKANKYVNREFLITGRPIIGGSNYWQL